MMPTNAIAILFIEASKHSPLTRAGLANHAETDIADPQCRPVIVVSGRDAKERRRIVPGAAAHDAKLTAPSARTAGPTSGVSAIATLWAVRKRRRAKRASAKTSRRTATTSTGTSLASLTSLAGRRPRGIGRRT